MFRWRRFDDQMTEYLQPQVLGIPGVFDNTLNRVRFSIQGAWFVTFGDDEADPGIVYFTPNTTSAFVEVGRVPDINVGRDYRYLTYPEGLVVCQSGTRLVSVFTPSGMIYQGELPGGFIGDTYPGASGDLVLVDVVYAPGAGGDTISAVFALDVPLTPESETRIHGVGTTKPVTPGQPMVWADELCVVQASGFVVRDIVEILPSLVSLTEGPGRYLTSGVSEPGGFGTSYRTFHPAPEVNPGWGMSHTRTRLYDIGEVVWPPTGVLARHLTIYNDAEYGEERLDGSGLPNPNTPSLQGGSTPVLNRLPGVAPFWTSFVRTQEVLGEPVTDPDSSNQYADFQLTAGSWIEPGPDGDVEVFGYSTYSTGGVEGNVVPGVVSISEVAIILTGCIYYGYMDEILITVEGVWGATSGKLVIDGVEYLLDIFEDQYETAGVGHVPDMPSPFEAGQTYDVRLYLDGDLRSEP